MHRDTVIGIVGVVILVAAMVGVFTYERGQAADLTGPGGTVANLTGPSDDGSVAVGSSTDVTMSINTTGLTNITFTLAWTPGNGVDTLKLSAAPGNDTGLTTGFESSEESDGEITLTIPLNNTATDGKVGTGAWQLTVTFVSASPGGPLPVSPPVAPPGSTDSAVDFTVESALQARQ